MKLAVLAFLLFPLVALADAQQTNPLCPTIEIIGPPGVTNPGDTLTFAATISSKSTSIKYVWKVSRGTIETGQGSASIVVRSTVADAGEVIEASVSIDGLPLGCSGLASESGPINQIIGCGMPSDEFGKMKPNDIRARLDNFFAEMTNNPDSIGVLLLRVPEKERSDRTNSRLKLFVQHARFRKFDLDRLIFKFEPNDELSTRFYRVPPGAEMPCGECVTIFGSELK